MENNKEEGPHVRIRDRRLEGSEPDPSDRGSLVHDDELPSSSAPLPPADPASIDDAPISSASLITNATRGMRFELVPNRSPEDAEDLFSKPFAVLSDAGRYSRVILGRVVSGGGSVVRDVALKIQKDEYGEQPFEDYGAATMGRALSNEAIHDLWRREYRSLSKFFGEHASVVEMLDLFERPAPNESPKPFPPVLYCRRTKQYFHPPCPQCGAILRDCKDDKLLQSVNTEIKAAGKQGDVGLYHASTRRALYCVRCADAAGEDYKRVRLYVRSYKEGLTSRDYAGIVKDRYDLFQEYGPVLEKEYVTDEMPCKGCQHREECHGAGKGSAKPVCRYLYPLSFYDFYAMPLDCLHLQYNYALQLAGGRQFRDLRQSLSRTLGQTSAHVHVLDTIEPVFTRGRQLIYGSDREQHSLEILKIKLSLFRDLCEGVAAVHGKCGPHLDLKPENIMVKVAPRRSELPALWSMDTYVIDLASAKPYFHDGVAEDQLIFEPPFNYNDVYTSPVISDHKSFGFNRKANLVIRSRESLADGSGAVRIHAILHGGELDAANYSDKDAISLKLKVNHPGLDNLSLRFRCEHDTGDRINRLKLTGTPIQLGKDQLKALDELIARRSPITDIDFYSYKCFHVPCDLFSLGILLLQTLLETRVVEAEKRDGTKVRRGQSIVEVRREALLFARKFEQWALREHEAKVKHGDAVREVKRWLVKEEEEWNALTEVERRDLRPPWCARENVFYQPDPGLGEAARGIPSDLFHDCLVVALRLITNVDGFSYCRDNSDFDPERPEEKIERVRDDVKRICDKIHTRLFGLQNLGREIHAVLDEIVGDESIEDVDILEGLSERAHAHVVRCAEDTADRILQSEGSIYFDRVRRLEELNHNLTQGLAALDGNDEERAFSAYLRERFPYVPPDTRSEKMQLEDQLERLRGQVAKLLGVAGVDSKAIPAERLDQLDVVTELCSSLIEFVEAIPTTLDEVKEAAETRGGRRTGEGRVRAILRQWAEGNDVDVQDEAKQYLNASRFLALRLLRAYQYAVQKGLLDVVEYIKADELLQADGGILDSMRRGNLIRETRAKLGQIRRLTEQELHTTYFWPHVTDGDARFRRALDAGVGRASGAGE